MEWNFKETKTARKILVRLSDPIKIYVEKILCTLKIEKKYRLTINLVTQNSEQEIDPNKVWSFFKIDNFSKIKLTIMIISEKPISKILNDFLLNLKLHII